ncbi:hypothetical protein [uncultured Zobellia sp.]|uniref:hypothetical protein n=1 Tax=uncultured Zobellia sp. TaxID=255433 RepID=UPI00259AC6BB|nr:hypothetical protein [uncultured Zobellia sp.]
MKKYTVMLLAAFLCTACNSQEKESRDKHIAQNKENTTSTPMGSWKINKEFDEAGNLIRYDSIYSYSSGSNLDELASFDRDSVLKSMQSRFYKNFSSFNFDQEGFGDFFKEDSLFTRRFFSDDFFESDFGKDFMRIDEMHERMEAMQKHFLNRYKPLIEADDDKDSTKRQ